MAVFYDTVGISATVNNAVGSNPSVPAGPQGEPIVTELHGKWYTAARAGAVFNATTAAAGTTVPVGATNLVSTFTLWNPNASGKNVELIRYSYGVLSATLVVSDLLLYYQSGLVSPGGTLTARAVKNTLFGAGLTSVCTFYTAATLVNTIDTNMFAAACLGSLSATSGLTNGINYDFDGSIILPPGSLVTVAGTAAQSAAGKQSLTFAEWPI